MTTRRNKTVRVTEHGAGETVWTEVATVPVKRGVNGRGQPPLTLQQHVAEGTFKGHSFTVGLNLGNGSLVLSISASNDDSEGGTRFYTVSPQNMIEAVIAAEFSEGEFSE